MILMVNPMILQLVTIDDAEKEKKDPNRKKIPSKKRSPFQILRFIALEVTPIGRDRRATDDNQHETTQTAAQHKTRTLRVC